MLEKYEETFVSFVVDGQYVSLDVLRSLKTQIMYDTQTPWNLFVIWDPTHVMEQAILDGFKKLLNLKKLVNTIQEVTKKI